MSLPATQICPVSGCSSLLSRRSNVDLPEPEGPTRNTNSPLAIVEGGVPQRDDVALVDLGDVLEL